MGPRPIFVATHPRSVSTAFERVFMTRRGTLECSHEPFADAFYLGPELMSERFKHKTADRSALGLVTDDTYQTVLDRFDNIQATQGKRLFIKDMAYYLMQPDAKPTSLAPSVSSSQEPGNPTVLPLDVLSKFHFTFLIRHPRRSIPSYYRCTIPPLSDRNGFPYFLPNEAGYKELCRLFDFLVDNKIVDKDQLTVIDADDLLDDPEPTIRGFCEQTSIDFNPGMLEWSEEDTRYAREKFAKFDGFHDDCLNTSYLHGRTHKQKTSTEESENAEWIKKFGPEAQEMIRKTVNDNIPSYEYLKQFVRKNETATA